MKSIVLIVLLALSHSSLGHSHNFRIVQRDGVQRLIDGNSYEESGIVREKLQSRFESSRVQAQRVEAQSVEARSVEAQSVEKAEKVDCNCNKAKARITYGQEQIVKGKPETYIHHQPKIIVRQPPTHVRIEHPPTVIEPSSIVFRRQGKIIRKPVIYQHLPQDVQVRPVIVRVVKPVEKKIFVGKEENLHSYPVLAQQHKLKESYSSLAQQHKLKESYSSLAQQSEEQSLELDTTPYTGVSYSQSYADREQERESLRAHINVKEISES